MTFRNSILAGEDLVRTAIRSPDYVAGLLGWRIARDGSAEFNNVTVRGEFLAQSPSGAYVRARATPTAARIDLQPPNGAETYSPGIVFADYDGLDTPLLEMRSALIAGQDIAAITLYGENSADGILPQVVLRCNGGWVDVNGGDLRVGNHTIGRGLMPNGFFRDTTNDIAVAAGINTDMGAQVDLEAGRTYRVQAHSQFNVGTAAAVYALELTLNAAIIGRFGRWSAAETAVGSTTCHVDGSVVFTSAVSVPGALLVLQNSPGSGGTVTMTAGAGNPRTFTVEDIGAP